MSSASLGNGLCFALLLASNFAAASTFVVDVTGMSFQPRQSVVAEGTTVTWTNSSTMIHTVTFDPAMARLPGSAAVPAGVAPFDLGLLRAGQSLSHTFNIAGEYRYFCRPHESMGHTGELIVIAALPQLTIETDAQAVTNLHAFVGQDVVWQNNSGEALSISVVSPARLDEEGQPTQVLSPILIEDQSQFVWNWTSEESLLVVLKTGQRELTHDLKFWSK